MSYWSHLKTKQPLLWRYFFSKPISYAYNMFLILSGARKRSLLQKRRHFKKPESRSGITTCLVDRCCSYRIVSMATFINTIYSFISTVKQQNRTKKKHWKHSLPINASNLKRRLISSFEVLPLSTRIKWEWFSSKAMFPGDAPFTLYWWIAFPCSTTKTKIRLESNVSR